MSLTRHVTIWCDYPNCGARVGQENTAAETRACGRRLGWKRRKGLDLCPFHATQEHPLEAML